MTGNDVSMMHSDGETGAQKRCSVPEEGYSFLTKSKVWVRLSRLKNNTRAVRQSNKKWVDLDSAMLMG